MKINKARRDFIKNFATSIGGLGLTAGGMEILSSSLLRNTFAQALTNPPPSNYVMWYLHLAPPRWMFDLLLTPSGKTAGNFVAGRFGTRFVHSSKGAEVEYHVNPHTIGGKTIYLPPVWKMSPGGQNFESILNNTLFIRGMHMEIDNHILSAKRQIAPTVGGQSINGAIASEYSTPIPGFIEDSTYPGQAFKSSKGYIPAAINYTHSGSNNPIRSALKPFMPFYSKRAAHEAGQRELQEQALQKFEQQSQIQGVRADALIDMYENAMTLVEENVYSLGSQWAGVYTKYHNLINSAIHPAKNTLPGLYDKAIAGSANDPRFRFERSKGDFVSIADIRDAIQPGTRISRLAENFALSELTLGTLTSNLCLGVRALSAVNFGRNFNMTNDQHYVGTIVSTMMTTLLYRGFLSGLTEQIRVLKSQKIFDKTVLHIASEFNRSPGADAAGSDHGFYASNATLISGMIEKMGVIGNIQVDTLNSQYPGTFGVAANYAHGGFNRPIQVNDVALTVTSLLGTNSVVTNGRSLLVPVANGKWKVAKDEAKNS